MNEDVPEKALYETILHELLHTLPGCMNHGSKWTKYADFVSGHYDMDIKPVSTFRDKGMSEPTIFTGGRPGALDTFEVTVQFDHSSFWFEIYTVVADDFEEARELGLKAAEEEACGIPVEVVEVEIV